MSKFYRTANEILNDVAVDVGLEPETDPVASTMKQFVQLLRQLNIALEELAVVYAWEQFKREATFTTDDTTNPDGKYALPSDFHYMINQTHWDRSNDLPLAGPLSSQDWQYLAGRDLASSTIYASFRQQEGMIDVWPSPPANGIEIFYEYASTNWVRDAANPGEYHNQVTEGAQTPLFAPTLLRGYLKSKYLGAKGFQTVDAEDAVALFLGTAAGNDAGAPVLNMGRRRNRHPYLEAERNLPDKGYGS